MIDRRTVLTGIALAAAAPALAQSQPMRRIGWLSPRSERTERNLDVFRRGLGRTGFVEGQNLMIDYRYAEGDSNRLPTLAGELLALRPEVVVATGGAVVARSVRDRNARVPIVFAIGNDPVREGLVESLARPGGRTTGIWVFTSNLGPKRLELLREVLPEAREIAFLVNPRNPLVASQELEMSEIARRYGLTLSTFRAGSGEAIDAAFDAMAARRVGGLVMGADTFFHVERDRIVALAERHALPTMYEWPEFVHAGGLMSYATATDDTWLQFGAYVGRILKGEDPGSLPVIQSANFALTVNLRTAKALGLTLPPSILLAAADIVE